MARHRRQDDAQLDMFAPKSAPVDPAVKSPPYSAVEVERLIAGKSMVCLGALGYRGAAPIVVCDECLKRIGAQATLVLMGSFASWLWQCASNDGERRDCVECGRSFVAEATVDMREIAG